MESKAKLGVEGGKELFRDVLESLQSIEIYL